MTGANGFLGSHLVDRLLQQKAEVHVLVRKSSSLHWLLGKKIHYHYGDVVGDQQGLRSGLKEADICLHSAGIIASNKPSAYYEVNAQGTANLLETCLEVNPKIKRVVVVSSIAAQGPGLNDEPLTEEDEPRPITDYGKSKRDAELVSLRYSDRLPITIVRPPAIYGPRDVQLYRYFKMARWGLLLLPRAKMMANLAYVQDVVSGTILAAERPEAVGETFLIGDEDNYEWPQAADIIAKSVRKNHFKLKIPQSVLIAIGGLMQSVSHLTGGAPKITIDQARNYTQRNWTIDISKAKKMLGFTPAFPLKRGADVTAAWYFEEGWL